MENINSTSCVVKSELNTEVAGVTVSLINLMKYSTTVRQAISEATDNFAYHIVGRKLTGLYLPDHWKDSRHHLSNRKQQAHCKNWSNEQILNLQFVLSSSPTGNTLFPLC